MSPKTKIKNKKLLSLIIFILGFNYFGGIQIGYLDEESGSKFSDINDNYLFEPNLSNNNTLYQIPVIEWNRTCRTRYNDSILASGEYSWELIDNEMHIWEEDIASNTQDRYVGLNFSISTGNSAGIIGFELDAKMTDIATDTVSNVGIWIYNENWSTLVYIWDALERYSASLDVWHHRKNPAIGNLNASSNYNIIVGYNDGWSSYWGQEIFLSNISLLYSSTENFISLNQNSMLNDTDGDGSSDGEEIYCLKTDPLSFNSPYNLSFEKTWVPIDTGGSNDIAIDSSSNIYQIGYTCDGYYGSNDWIIAKYNSQGQILWNITWGKGSDDVGYGIAVDSNDFIYAIGTEGNEKITLIKLSEIGEIIWIQTWDEIARAIPKGITIDSYNNIYVAGYCGADLGSTNIVIIKYTQEGTKMWDQIWGGSNYEGRYSMDLTIDNEDNAIIACQTNSYGIGGDIALLKYNPEGTLIVEEFWGGTSYDGAYTITTDNEDNIYIGGQTDSYGSGSRNAIILKFDSTGNYIWSTYWEGNYAAYCNDIIVSKQGQIYAIGETNSLSSDTDLFLISLNQTGNIISSTLWRSSEYSMGDEAEAIIFDKYENIYITGSVDMDMGFLLLKYMKDRDIDGMPDLWEESYNLTSLFNDSNLDLDGDELTNLEEYIYGTNPSLVDSDNDGFSDFEEKEFILTPDVYIAFNSSNIFENEYIQFYDMTISQNLIVTYNWDFGDGTSASSEQNPIHQYTTIGTYLVNLSIWDELAYFNSTIISIQVSDNIPFADFSCNCSIIYEGNCINFTDTSEFGDHPLLYKWDFGDGTSTSSEQNPIHQYTTIGTYLVNLSIWDNDGDFNSTCKEIIVLEDLEQQWNIPEPFIISLDDNIELPLKVNNVDIEIAQEIFPNAEIITLYISSTRFTTNDLETGSIFEITFNSYQIEEITPGMINRYHFTGLENGTYYIGAIYSNPLGNASSNILSISVILDNNDITNGNANFNISSYSTLWFSFVSILGISMLLWKKSLYIKRY